MKTFILTLILGFGVRTGLEELNELLWSKHLDKCDAKAMETGTYNDEAFFMCVPEKDFHTITETILWRPQIWYETSSEYDG